MICVCLPEILLISRLPQHSVASGLRAFYTEEQFAPGRLVAVVTNLKPAKMAGFESAGMVLAASNEDHTKVELVEVPEGAKPGERIFIEGLEGDALAPNQCAKKNVLKNVLPDLKTDAACIVGWQVYPTPYTLHPTPYTLHPTPYTLHHATHTLHPAPCTQHPTLDTLHHKTL